MKPFLTNCLRKCAAIALLLSPLAMQGQQAKIQNWRPYDQSGINVFESPKDSVTSFDGLKVRIGAGFTQQFQSLKHSNTAGSPALYPRLKSGFNLAQANLNIDVQLADGIALNLVTYLSARHHNEAWVKGGYIQIDNLDFISQGFLGGLMKNARVKIGMDELNYGDSHFRRTDNAKAINNAFVENNIMDSFTTQAFGEVYYYSNGFMGMVGLSNGKLNQTAVKGTNDNSPSIYAKLAYDKQLSEDLRFRLSGSVIKTNGLNTNGKLFGDDRGGSRY